MMRKPEKETIENIKTNVPPIINPNLISTFVRQNQRNSKKFQSLYSKKPYLRVSIFEGIYPELLDISKDIYGNHLIRKILQFKEKDKIDRIFSKLKENIKELAIDNYGTFVIQELIQKVNEVQLKKISNVLVKCPDFKEFIKNKNVRKVIEELIKRQDKNDNDEICKKILTDFIPFCNNEFTSFIIEKLLLNCNETYYKEMKKECLNNLLILSKNESGVHIIKLFIQKHMEEFFEPIKNDVFNLSQTQFGVLVVKEIIEDGNQNQQNLIIEEIVKAKNENIKNNLVFLSQHQYGNFIIQKIFEFLDENTKISLKNALYLLKEQNRYANYVWENIQK